MRAVGDVGESIAEKYLLSKGAKILARNYTIRGGEIDLIAELNDPDEEIRAYVAGALGQLSTAEAKAALSKQLETEASPWVREELTLVLQ